MTLKLQSPIGKPVKLNWVTQVENIARGPGVPMCAGETVFAAMLPATPPDGFQLAFKLDTRKKDNHGLNASRGPKIGVWVHNAIMSNLGQFKHISCQFQVALEYGFTLKAKEFFLLTSAPVHQGWIFNIIHFKNGSAISVCERLINSDEPASLSMESRMVVDGIEQRHPGVAVYWLEPKPQFSDPRVQSVPTSKWYSARRVLPYYPTTLTGALQRFRFMLGGMVLTACAVAALVVPPYIQYDQSRLAAQAAHAEISATLGNSGGSLQETAAWAQLEDQSNNRSKAANKLLGVIASLPAGATVQYAKLVLEPGVKAGSSKLVLSIQMPANSMSAIEQAEQFLGPMSKASNVALKLTNTTVHPQQQPVLRDFIVEGTI